MNGANPDTPRSEAAMRLEVQSPGPARRRFFPLRRFLKWFLGSLIVLLTLILVLLWVKDPVFKAIAEKRIQDETGLRAEIGRLSAGLGSKSLLVEDFKIYNTKEFGGAPLVDVPDLYLWLDGDKSVDGKLYFKEIRFHLAEMNVVRNEEGRLNIEGLQKSIQKPAPSARGRNDRKKKEPAESGYRFGGIEKLYLTLGTLNYTDLKQPSKSRKVVLGIENELVTDLDSQQDFRNWLGSFLLRVFLQEYFKKPGQFDKDARLSLELP